MTYAEIAGSPEFAALTPEEKKTVATNFWANNPDRAAVATSLVDTTSALKDAAPVERRFLEAKAEDEAFQLLDVTPEQAQEYQTTREQRNQRLESTRGLFSEDGAQMVSNLIDLGRRTNKFGTEPLAAVAGDLLTDDSTERRNQQYDEAKTNVANQFNLTPDELDDVVKHNLDAQEKPVSRDAFGTVHIKNDQFFKPKEELVKTIEESDLPASVKARQIEGLDTRLDEFKAGVVGNIAKNHPEYAAFVGFDGKDDFNKIKDTLLTSKLENETTAGVNVLRKSGEAIFRGLDKIDEKFAGKNDRIKMFDEVADAVEQSRKIDEGQLALSNEFNKEKLRLFGTTGGSIGSGAASVLESAALAYATGGMVPTLSGTGRIIGAANSALKVAPVATVFGARQGMQITDQAIAQGMDEKEAIKLGIVGGFIEGGLTMAFSAAGLGGAESMAAGATREVVKKTVANSLKAIGAGVIGEELEENAINALDQALVQTQLNPNLNVKDFKQSILDTTVATLLPAAGVGAVTNIPTFSQNDTQLEQTANDIYSEEELPPLANEVGLESQASPEAVAAERAGIEQRLITAEGDERVALEERLGEIEAENPSVVSTDEDIAPENIPLEPQPDQPTTTPVDEPVIEVQPEIQEDQYDRNVRLRREEHQASNLQHSDVGPQLNNLEDSWRDQGVDLKVSIGNDGLKNVPESAIYLDVVNVPQEQRGKGIGTNVLNDLKKVSDETGRPIYLVPTDLSKDNSQPNLPQFYEKNGFKPFDRGSSANGRKLSDGYFYEPQSSPSVPPVGVEQEAGTQQAAVEDTEPAVEAAVEPSVVPETTTPAVATTITSPQTPVSTPSTPIDPDEENIMRSTNASLDRDLKKFGLDPVSRRAPGKLREWWNQAVVEVTKNPSKGTALTQEIVSKPQAINELELNVLAYTRATQQVQSAKTRQQINAAQAAGNSVLAASLNARLQGELAQLQETTTAIKIGTSTAGKVLRASQVGVDENYNLVSMQNRVQAEINVGKPLDSSQEKLVRDLNAKIKESEDAVQSAIVDTEVRVRKEMEKYYTELMAREAAPRKSPSSNKKTPQQKVEDLTRKAKEAQARLNARFLRRAEGGQLFSGGLTEEDIVDAAIIATSYIRAGAVTLADFTVKLVEKFGESAREFAGRIFDEASAQLNGLPKTPQQLLAEIDPSKPLNRQTVWNMAKAYAGQGLKASELVDKAHADLKTKWKNISRDTVVDQINGYGQTVRPTRSALQQELLDLRRYARLQKRIEDLKAGKLPATNSRPKSAISEEIRQLQEQEKELGADLRTEDRTVKGIEARTKRIREKIAKGEFSKEIKPTKAETDRIQKARLEEFKAKEEWNHLFFENNLKNASRYDRFIRGASQPIELLRTWKTMFDLPPIFRQGVGVLVSNPAIAIKAWPKSFIAGVTAGFGNDTLAKKAEMAIRDNPQFDLFNAAGLAITQSGQFASLKTQEEEFRGSLIKKIPLLKNAANYSEANYVTFLNELRIGLATQLGNYITRSGAAPTLAEAKVIADYVNNVTGRGSLRGLEGAANTISAVFFSPRYWASRLNFLAGGVKATFDVTTGFKFAPQDVVRARKAVAREYAKVMIGYGMFYGSLILAAAGYDDPEDKFSIEWNPISSDFGKVKIGKTRIDPLGGLAGHITFISRAISFHNKTLDGEVYFLPDAKGNQQNYFGIISNYFVRTKLAPIYGSIINVGTGKDVVGKKATVRSEIAGTFLPLSVTDIAENFEEYGPAGGVGLSFLTLLGAGTNTYDDGLTWPQRAAVAMGEDPNEFLPKKKKAKARLSLR